MGFTRDGFHGTSEPFEAEEEGQLRQTHLFSLLYI
jgi:hypothetical protein